MKVIKQYRWGIDKFIEVMYDFDSNTYYISNIDWLNLSLSYSSIARVIENNSISVLDESNYSISVRNKLKVFSERGQLAYRYLLGSMCYNGVDYNLVLRFVDLDSPASISIKIIQVNSAKLVSEYMQGVVEVVFEFLVNSWCILWAMVCDERFRIDLINTFLKCAEI